MLKIQGIFLERFQIIVPVGDELLIALKIRRIDPFAYLDLTLARCRAFMDLEKIFEGVVLIEPAQRKDAADTGAYGMDGTPLSAKKGTCIFLCGHPQVGKDNTVHNVQFKAGVQQFFEGFPKPRAEPVGVEGV